jgi:Protein of unknown function (DUF2946)
MVKWEIDAQRMRDLDSRHVRRFSRSVDLVGLMRQRLQLLIPVLLVALMVQILAPVGASWAAALAISDPLRAVEICHSDSAGSPARDDQGSSHAHDECGLCCAAQVAASLDAPPSVTVAEPHLRASTVTWRALALTSSGSRVGSNRQARAPPSLV